MSDYYVYYKFSATIFAVDFRFFLCYKGKAEKAINRKNKGRKKSEPGLKKDLTPCETYQIGEGKSIERAEYNYLQKFPCLSLF